MHRVPTWLTYLAHKQLYSTRVSLTTLCTVGTMYHNPIVRFVDEVRTAAYIVHAGWRQAGRTTPNPKSPLCSRMCHQPDMAVVVLRKTLDLCEQAADMLCLSEARRPFMIQLIVGVNNQSFNSISATDVVRFPLIKTQSALSNISTT